MSAVDDDDVLEQRLTRLEHAVELIRHAEHTECDAGDHLAHVRLPEGVRMCASCVRRANRGPL